jgi:hypothetical protein
VKNVVADMAAHMEDVIAVTSEEGMPATGPAIFLAAVTTRRRPDRGKMRSL